MPVPDETPLPDEARQAEPTLSIHDLATVHREVLLGLPPSLTTPAAQALREATLKDIEEAKRRGLPTFVLAPLDQIQAVKHHPEFQRYFALWRDIFHKQAEGIDLTDEEEALKRQPRSKFSMEAELEASRYGLLSLAERDLTTMSEEERAWRDCAPQLDWVNKTATIHIPLDQPLNAIEKIVGHIVRVYQHRLGITPTQRLRRPTDVDPWQVYRWHHDEGLSLLDITHRLFGTSGSTAYDPELKRRLEKVRRAYQFALAALDRISQDYA